MSESIETIEREFAQSQKRSEERRTPTRRRDGIGMFLSIIAILLVVSAVIVSVLILVKI